jgi:glycosyltransferase involved in cell wall biosynthesis
MIIEMADTASIKPYPANPRRNDRAVDVVVESIRQYGFQQPIVVDSNRVIIVGHTRYKAAKRLKLVKIPVIVANELTEEQAQAYRLADNKTNEYAAWDDPLLTTELRELLSRLNDDLSLTASMTAFSELEIDRLLNGKNYATSAEELAKARGDEPITRRVGLVVLKHSYVNRGVTTYINGWLEWGLRSGVQVDIISNDSDVANTQFDRYNDIANWISPDSDIVKSNLDADIAMRSPIVRLKDAVDLRAGLMRALSTYSYDVLIINSLDTLLAAISIGLDRQHDNMYYVTHSEMDIGRGPDNFLTDLTRSLLETSPIRIICQSEYTRGEFLQHTQVTENRITVMTPPLGQPELLECLDDTDFSNRSGILYIGPYEPRKNPEVFIRACKSSGHPAILITPSQKSADKFKRRFLEEGIEHTIHVALTGASKVDAMRSAALAIIPSVEETFCYTAFEAAHVCRTIIPWDRDWTTAHDKWCIRVAESAIHRVVDEHYGQAPTAESRAALRDAQLYSDFIGLSFTEQESHTAEVNNALTKYIQQKGSTTVKEFFNSRPNTVLDEIFYIIKLRNNSAYKFTHTQDATIIELANPQSRIDQVVVDTNLAAAFNLEKTVE